MKKMKKIFSLMLAMVMVFSMTATVFAADYTITAPDGDTHTYEVYQIFTGDLHEDETPVILSNVKWGTNGTGETGADVAETILDKLAAIASSTSDAEKLAVITQYVDLTTTPVATLDSANTSASVPAGYYLIKDKDGSVSGSDTYTTYIVEVVDSVTIKRKADVPEFEKKIKDTNDTDGEVTDWQDSADYDIGDEIPFKLEGTVADDYAEYESYYYAFHDVEETGLTFNADSVKVYIDGEEITSGYTVKTETTDGCTFEVIFADLKVTSAKAGSKVTVEYTSTLNENAVLGSQGNVNKAQLEYSNNPNNEQGGTGKSTWDNVIVFTYKVIVNKYKEEVKEGNELTGAEFTLYKVLSDGTKQEITAVTSATGTSFEFSGLDDGDYVLSETKTPAGYNTIEDITFTVTAVHDIVWTTQSRNAVLTSLSGNAASGEIRFTANVSDGSLSTDVINNKGTTLPETGGMGTTIFYVVGVVLVLGAGILLVTKRRMSAR